MKYRKKPVVVEAMKYDKKLPFPNKKAPDWIHKGFANRLFHFSENNELLILTLEGNMIVSDGDYIIKGVQGEFYPCKPDIFEQTYEFVGE